MERVALTKIEDYKTLEWTVQVVSESKFKAVIYSYLGVKDGFSEPICKIFRDLPDKTYLQSAYERAIEEAESLIRKQKVKGFR